LPFSGFSSAWWASLAPSVLLGIAPSPVEVRVVAAASMDAYATFVSDATGASAAHRHL
jgi:hypothetical protein